MNLIEFKGNINLTNDYLFKRLFGTQKNKLITQNFLSALLGYNCSISEIRSNDVTEIDLVDDKIGVLDVFIKNIDNTQINIEMQVKNHDFLIERILFYWSKKFFQSISSGDDYSNFSPTKVILIADFCFSKLHMFDEIKKNFMIMDVDSRTVILSEYLELIKVFVSRGKNKKYRFVCMLHISILFCYTFFRFILFFRFIFRYCFL